MKLMLVPEKHEVVAIFAALAVDGSVPWPYTAEDVAYEIAKSRNLVTLPVWQRTAPPPVSIAMTQGLLADLAAEGALVVRTAARWRRLGIGFVLDQRNEVCDPVAQDRLMYGRPQDEQAWHEKVAAEHARVRRAQAEYDALLCLRDRHPDEYAGLVAEAEGAPDQPPRAPAGSETKQAGYIA